MRRLLTAAICLAWLLGALGRTAPAWADAWGDARKTFRGAQRSDDWKERRAAYLALLDFDGEKAFEEVLSTVLKEKNAAVVLEGIKTLASFETPEARALFDKELEKARGPRCLYLLMARAEQRGEHGVEQLVGFLRGKDEVNAALAATALGHKAAEAGLAPLLEALGHKDWHVAAAAARGVQRIAWSARTPPNKRTGEGPQPTQPAWFDKGKAVAALAAALPEAAGPARGSILEALDSISGMDYGDNEAAWRAHVAGKTPSAAVLAKRQRPPYWFKIPVYAERVVIVMDVSVLTDNAHPFKDRARLQELCAVPGAHDVPWFKLKSIWQFNAAHVKRFVNDMSNRGVKFELIFSGLKPGPVFGKLTPSNAGSKETAAEAIDKAKLFTQNDILAAMNAALDVSGKKDAVAWTKGPDLVLCVYSSVPWQAEETDPIVVGSAIGLKARMRCVQIHAVGVHEFAYGMMKLFAGQSDGRYLELTQ